MSIENLRHKVGGGDGKGAEIPALPDSHSLDALVGGEASGDPGDAGAAVKNVFCRGIVVAHLKMLVDLDGRSDGEFSGSRFDKAP